MTDHLTAETHSKHDCEHCGAIDIAKKFHIVYDQAEEYSEYNIYICEECHAWYARYDWYILDDWR